MNKIELYSYSDKNTRVWIAYYDDKDLFVEYGTLNGKLHRIKKDIPVTKTPEQEALFLYTKKLNSGYVKRVSDVKKNKEDSSGFPKFMLAQKNIDNITFPAYLQPKFNGVRASMSWEIITLEKDSLFQETKEGVVFRSKNGIPYNMERISNFVENKLGKAFFRHAGYEIIFDGELYIHGKPLNEIKSSCPFIKNGVVYKSSNNVDLVKFVIFDIIIQPNIKIKQQDRFNMMANILENSILNLEHKTNNFMDLLINQYPLLYSEVTTVNTKQEAIEKSSMFLNKGFEGGIVRNYDGYYEQGKRSKHLCKIKFQSQDVFEIVDIIKKNKLEDTAKFILKAKNNNLFESMPMGSFEIRQEYLHNKSKYIGKFALVKYGELSGDKQVPFHSNVIEVINK